MGWDNAERWIHATGWGPYRLHRCGRGAHLGHGTGGPVSRSGRVAAAGQGRVLRTEPGRDAAPAVGDDERVAAPCDDRVTSTRNSNSLFACRWLRARDVNPRLTSSRRALCRPSLKRYEEPSR